MCIDSVSGLLDLIHAPTIYVEYLATQPWACGSSSNNILSPEDGQVVLQFSPNLVPQLGCSVDWMNMIPVYLLVGRLFSPCQYTNRTYGMLGNISVACGSSLNNVLNPEDGLVVLQFSLNLVPHL